jgi:TRAP-type transport system small permease protein
MQKLAIRWLEHFLVVGLSVMGLMVFANVVLRYVFDTGIAVTEEVSRFIFVWLTFVGATVAMFEGLHLGVDAVINALPTPMRTVCQVIARLLMLSCCVALLIGSWTQTRLNIHNVAALSGIPVALMYSAGMFASIIMAGIILKELWLIMNGAKVEEDRAGENSVSEA